MQQDTPKIQHNVPLANYTSFGIGGAADAFVAVSSTDELLDVVTHNTIEPLWLLGYGSNTLISDAGLRGLTICIRGGAITQDTNGYIVDAGVWWDDVVSKSIDEGLWGIELLSNVPGSVGAAIYINITAYGQSMSDVVEWVEVWDPRQSKVIRLQEELRWDYKKSIFQLPEHSHWIILRAKLHLSPAMTTALRYQKAIDAAQDLSLNPDTLANRRTIITEARRRAGSLWTPDHATAARTAGSFFRNPIVSKEKAATIMTFDESGKTVEEVKSMNIVHGGSTTRVSAAHVLLAAGFHRGQQWGKVKLNDANLLKIEALPGATAQEVYDVMQHIETTCWDTLGVCLEPEARILGEFTHNESTM